METPKETRTKAIIGPGIEQQDEAERRFRDEQVQATQAWTAVRKDRYTVLCLKRPAGSREEDDHEDDSATRYVARRLFDQLKGGFNGCSAEEHQGQRREHNQDLNELFNDPTFPSVLCVV